MEDITTISINMEKEIKNIKRVDFLGSTVEEQIEEIKRIGKKLGLKKIQMINPETKEVEVEIDIEE